MKKTMSILSVAALTAFVVGCSSSSQTMETDSMEALTNKIDMLSEQVKSLEMQQSNTRTAVESVESTTDAALKEAMRANQRIDNVATSYKK